MNNKRQFALNKLFNIFIIAGIGLSVVAFYDVKTINDLKDSLPLIALAVFFVALPAILMPYCYIFDNKGVTAHYIFLPNERYLWANIYGIRVDYDDSGTSSSMLFNLLFSKSFKIQGDVEGKKRFYMEGKISKSWKSKRLIEQYWDGAIDNCLFEKKTKKKVKLSKAYSTADIIPIEREMKSLSKQCIVPFYDEIVQYGLELQKRYVYLTSDFIELNTRPLEPYTYTVLIDISRPGETDKENIWTISVDLLYARLGRDAYKGVKNKNAINELKQILEDTVEAIRNNEIECLVK